MHNFEELVDKTLLGAMMDWARPVHGFRSEHAACALFCTTDYIRGWLEPNAELRTWLALNSAYWWWLDDLSDQHVDDPDNRVDWTSLERAVQAGLPNGDGPPEVEYLHRLAVEFRARARNAHDFDWWLAAALGTIQGFREEDINSRAGRTVSLAEHLEISFWSTSLVHVMSAMSLLFGLGLGERKPMEPSTVERLVCLIARLENDLFSADKERVEGNKANAVLLMEHELAEDSAPFVDAMLRGYQQRLERGLVELGAEHPLTRIARGMMAAHEKYYSKRPGRYVGSVRP